MRTEPAQEPADSVLVATAQIRRRLLPAVLSGAQAAGAVTVDWPSEILTGARGHPPVLITELPPGVRQLPEEVMTLCRSAPGLRLLILCNEPLVESCVSLQDGRIVLLEPPLEAERIGRRLRILLGRRAPSPEPGLATPLTRENTRRRWWMARINWPHDPRLTPSVQQHLPHGFTVLVSEAVTASRELHLRRAVQTILTDADEATIERGLAGVLDPSESLLHLSPTGDRWQFYRADPPSGAWIYSRQRLPQLYDWHRALEKSGTRFSRLTAAKGDLVALSSADLSSATSEELRAAFADGGPALLDWLESRLPLAARPNSSLIVQVT